MDLCASIGGNAVSCRGGRSRTVQLTSGTYLVKTWNREGRRRCGLGAEPDDLDELLNYLLLASPAPLVHARAEELLLFVPRLSACFRIVEVVLK